MEGNKFVECYYCDNFKVFEERSEREWEGERENEIFNICIWNIVVEFDLCIGVLMRGVNI